MPDAPRMVFPPENDDIYSITREKVVKIAQKKRQDLFGEQREKLYSEIWNAARNGKYCISFVFD